MTFDQIKINFMKYHFILTIKTVIKGTKNRTKLCIYKY